ncbi:MAG TPA: hypothetical protein VGF55_21725 [Gemmataceae bacterium]
MKCFNHPDQDAVAACRWCSRCLCRACCLECPRGIVCRPQCQTDLERYWGEVDEINAATLKAYRKRKLTPIRRYLLSVVTGFILLSMVAYLIFLGAVIANEVRVH